MKTLGELKEMMPSGNRYNITEEMFHLVQGMGDVCSIEQEYMEESFLSHLPSFKNVTNVSLKQYIDAIKYCNLKQNMSNIEAWKIVFPDKLKALRTRGQEKYISQNVSAYNRRKLISAIDADMAIAMHIQYSPVRHEAIQHQVDLFRGIASPTKMPVYKKILNGEFKRDSFDRKIQATHPNGEPVFEDVWMVVTPKIQQEASKAIIELTKMPEDKNINIKIGLSDEAIESNREMTNKFREIAELQREALLNGANIDDVQKIGHIISDGDIEDADIEDK